MAASEYKAIPGNENQQIDLQFHRLLKWGYIYYPKVCLTESCKLAIPIHGCGGNAFSDTKMYGPNAAANKTVLLIPQGGWCWDTLDPKGSNGTFTNQGFMEIFYKKMIDRLTSPVNGKYNYEFENDYKGVNFKKLPDNLKDLPSPFPITGHEYQICYNWDDENG